jgi:uncharacterized tellurite resistance protein B-like protein
VLDRLETRDRLRLMKFVCSFAWADLEIRPEEREYVAKVMAKLGLSDEERRQVEGWLEVPPSPDSVDPTSIPQEHKLLFLEAVEGVIIADGEISPEERENLGLFKALLE